MNEKQEAKRQALSHAISLMIETLTYQLEEVEDDLTKRQVLKAEIAKLKTRYAKTAMVA